MMVTITPAQILAYFASMFCIRRFFFLLGLLLCQEVAAQVYTGVGGPITDNGVANFYPQQITTLTPSVLDSAHGLVSVCIRLTHTYDGDLDVQLISPNGNAVTLFSGIGADGDNFTNTCLTHQSSINILNGSAPFTGSFSPEDNLGNVNNGSDGNGLWKLRILDTYPGADTGELLQWSLTFGAHAALPMGIDSTKLPIVQIFTNGQTIENEPKISANLQIRHKGNGGWNRPTDPPNAYNGFIGIEIRGSFSASLPQKPYGFETRTETGANLDSALLGMPKENDWILLSTYNDKTFVRNSLASNIFQQMGHYAPRSRFCEVLLNQNYKGIYLLMEKIKRDTKRVNLAKLDTNENTGDDVTGGYIIKVDYHDASNSWLSSFHPVDHPSFNVYFVFHQPDAFTISGPQKQYIATYLNSLETALYSSTFSHPTQGYRAFLDVPSFIDYFLVNELSRNNDGFKKSYYFHKDKASNGGLLRSGPVWDFDWAWKNINECSIFSATNGSGWAYKVNNCNPDNNSPGWAVRLLQDSTFANQLHCRYAQLRTSILDTLNLFHYLDSVQVLVNEAQERHYRKWPILGINVGTPEVGSQPLTYAGEITKLKSWIKKRLVWLDANMPGHCIQTLQNGIVHPGQLSLYPNPTNQTLWIESDLEIKRLDWYSATGKAVRSETPHLKSVRFDLADLPQGIYHLQCRLENGLVVNRRMVKL